MHDHYYEAVQGDERWKAPIKINLGPEPDCEHYHEKYVLPLMNGKGKKRVHRRI